MVVEEARLDAQNTITIFFGVLCVGFKYDCNPAFYRFLSLQKNERSMIFVSNGIRLFFYYAKPLHRTLLQNLEASCSGLRFFQVFSNVSFR